MSKPSKSYEALMKRLQQAKNRGRKHISSSCIVPQSSSSSTSSDLKDDWFDELLSSSPSQLWLCGTCTYKNEMKYKICEMCGDSKDKLNEDSSIPIESKTILNVIFEELENIYSEIEALKEKNEDKKYEEDSLINIGKRECQNITDKMFEVLLSVPHYGDEDKKKSLKDYLDGINEQIESLASDNIVAFYYKIYHQNGVNGGIQGICYFITIKDIYELSIMHFWETKEPFLNPYTRCYHNNIKRIYSFNEGVFGHYKYGSYMDGIISISMTQSEVKELQFIRGSDGYPEQFNASKYIKDDKEKFRSLYTKIPGKELLPLPPLWLEIRDEKGEFKYVNTKTFKVTGVRPDK